MYSIQKEFVHFFNVSNYSLYLLNYTRNEFCDQKKIYVYSSGVLNLLWQSWNKFWRTLWLVYMVGGIDINKNRVSSYKAKWNESEAIYYLLHILGKKEKSSGKIVGSYQEVRWGRIDYIEILSRKIQNPGIGGKIINTISISGQAPEHLQKIRNATIHLDRDTMKDIEKLVVPYYNLAINKIRYPTDILFSQHLASGKTGIQNLVDELRLFLRSIWW